MINDLINIILLLFLKKKKKKKKKVNNNNNNNDEILTRILDIFLYFFHALFSSISLYKSLSKKSTFIVK